MWKVRLYKNTGLNTANTVDKGSRLDSAQYVDVPPLEILQGEHLREVRVKATRAVIKDVDYMKLEDEESGDVFYYAVDPFMKTSIDVTTLYLTPDAVMTAAEITGGIENVEFGDGIVDRHHVAKNDDTFGAYTEDDPLLVPSKELELQIDARFSASIGDDHHLVESTMSLHNMAKARDAITYTDGGGGGTVTVPQTVPALEFTRIYIGDDLIYVTPGSEYYDHNIEKTQLGIARVRSLGAEGCILNSWIVPAGCCEYAADENWGLVGAIAGTLKEETSNIDLEESYNVENNRLKYGRLNMVTLMSPAAGTSISFLPEDLVDDPSNPGKVIVERLCDPRPKGMPYFYPKYYKGNVLGRGKWMQVLPGMQWSQAPLLYSENSGSTLAQIRYETNKEYNLRSAELSAQQALGQRLGSSVAGLTGATNNMMGTVGSAMAPAMPTLAYSPDDSYPGGRGGFVRNEALDAMKDIYMQQQNAHNISLGFATTALNAAGRVVTDEIAQHYTFDAINAQYAMNATRELQNLALATQVRVPELVFPRSETTRDFVGNGIYVVKTKIQDSDLQKLDKMLNMYGYKNTAALEKDMFTNRSKFNYISAKAVSVTDKRLPLWLRELLAAQLKNGVRIWHQLPDAAAYTDGSNT